MFLPSFLPSFLRPPPANTTYHHTWASVGHTWSLRLPPANTTYHHTFCWSYMITTSATCKHNLSSHLLLVIHDHYVRYLQTQPIITPKLLLVIHDHYVRYLQTQPIITPKLLLVIHDHYVRYLQTQPIITVTGLHQRHSLLYQFWTTILKGHGII